MKIFRSINNNIVSAYDDSGKEVVIIGKGIGFKAKEGDLISENRIEKIFLMSSQNETDRLKELFASLPEEYIKLTDEILTFAKDQLKKRLHEGAYITLADHISFAITRLKHGLNFQNVLHSEIKRFYPNEYAIGCYALDLIKERLNIVMPKDEAASIALHIFNAEYDISVSDAFHATELLDQILVLITGQTGLIVDSTNYYCERFLSHLKFLTQRIIRKEYLPKVDDEFYLIISQNYQEETKCSEAVAEMLLKEEGYEMSQEEISSMTIHLKRIGTPGEKDKKRKVVNEMFGKMKGIFGKGDQEIVVSAPVAGTVVGAEQINDPTFKEQLLGKTVGIKPSGSKVVAPVKGRVDSVFDTGHAVTVISDEGVQLIIHVGLDTVNLQGKYFTIHAKAGDQVKPGDLLIEFDKQGIENEGYDSVTAVIICNSAEYSQVEAVIDVEVKEADPMIRLKK